MKSYITPKFAFIKNDLHSCLTQATGLAVECTGDLPQDCELSGTYVSNCVEDGEHIIGLFRVSGDASCNELLQQCSVYIDGEAATDRCTDVFTLDIVEEECGESGCLIQYDCNYDTLVSTCSGDDTVTIRCGDAPDCNTQTLVP